MESIKLCAHVGGDGLLNLRVPVRFSETDVEVVVVVQELPHPPKSTGADGGLAWPSGYFEQTYGCLKNNPLVRPAQGEFETRQELR